MGLASHRSATEVSAVQQLPERWAAYDNRCLNRRIVGWLPWKQMLKTPPSCHFLTFPLFLLFFLFPRRLSHSLSFLIFFFFSPLFYPLWSSLRFDHFDPFCCLWCLSCFLSHMHTHWSNFPPFLLPSPFFSLSPQLHPQWELFLLLAFCERATRSASPAQSPGTLCKSVCMCFKCFVFWCYLCLTFTYD